MSWRGNRPVPTGVQAGREIGARSGWGAYCRGAGGIRNTTQSLEVAQGEEKGASKVDKSQVLPKWNWIGNICAEGLFHQDNRKIYLFWPVSPDNFFFRPWQKTRPQYKSGKYLYKSGPWAPDPQYLLPGCLVSAKSLTSKTKSQFLTKLEVIWAGHKSLNLKLKPTCMYTVYTECCLWLSTSWSSNEQCRADTVVQYHQSGDVPKNHNC